MDHSELISEVEMPEADKSARPGMDARSRDKGEPSMPAKQHQDPKKRYFLFGGFPNHHRVGDEGCRSGQCGAGFPKKCKCGGLIHCNANFAGFNSAEWSPVWACDRCDSKFEPADGWLNL
jgi:hypothetical protein